MARTTNDISDAIGGSSLSTLDGATLITMGGWIYRSASLTWAGAGASTDGSNALAFVHNGSNDHVFIIPRNASSTFGRVDNITFSGWNHYLCLYDGGGSTDNDKIKVYLNGTLQTISSWTGSPPTTLPSSMPWLWGSDNLSGTRYHAGSYAEWGVWAGTLTTDQISSLAKGRRPIDVAPEILAHYWPIYGRQSPEPDLVGGVTSTVTGTTTFEHPRVFRRPPRIWRPNAAAAAANVLWAQAAL